MELEVRSAKGGTSLYWLRGLARQLLFWPPRAEPGDDEDAPAVVAKSDGTTVVLQRTGTARQATRALARYQRELERDGEDVFRQRYGLHESMLDADSVARGRSLAPATVPRRTTFVVAAGIGTAWGWIAFHSLVAVVVFVVLALAIASALLLADGGRRGD